MEEKRAGRVLLVDDDPASCESLAALFEDEGYLVSAAQDAGTAIQLLEAETFDAVLADFKLEGSDGLELLDHIARTRPGLRVILVTGYASLGSAIRAVQKGAFDYLVKPVEIRDVLAAVERAVELGQAEVREKDLLRVLETRNAQLAKRLCDLDALHRAGSSLITTLDLDRLLSNIVGLAAKVVSARMGSVMLLDESGKRLVLRAAVGLDDLGFGETVLRVGEGIAGYVAERNEPVLIRDVESDRRFGRKNRPRYETRSLVSVPLRVGEAILGVLNMSDKSSGEAFSEEDLRMLTTFAAQAAVAVERARLFAAMKRRLGELSVLYQISCAIGSVDTLEKTIDIIITSLGQIAHVEQCMWMAWNEETGRLETEFVRGVSDRSRLMMEGLRIEGGDGEGLPADCWEETGCPDERREHCPAFTLGLGRACWVITRGGWTDGSGTDGVTSATDCSSCSFFGKVKEGASRPGVALQIERLLAHVAQDDPGLQSFVAAPVVVQGRLRGIFWVGSSHRRAFSEDDRQLLSIVASQAVSLYEQSSEMAKARQLATMGEMISEIAHDLRHPMTVMTHCLGLLEREWNVESRRKESMRILSNEVVRLNGLVDELLLYSNPTRYAMHRVDVRTAIERALSLVEDDLKGRGIQLRKEYSDHLHTAVMNEGQIVGVLLNVIINALQAMRDGGELVIRAGDARGEEVTAFEDEGATRAWASGGCGVGGFGGGVGIEQRVLSQRAAGAYVRIDISDTGVGIPAEEIPKVFTPFFTTKETGTGLGLAGVDRVMKTHGGLARVESRVGEGTTLSLFLPRAGVET